MDLPALAELELDDAHGATHRFADLLAERTTVLVFLRHFG
jgi:hypothetical protein